MRIHRVAAKAVMLIAGSFVGVLGYQGIATGVEYSNTSDAQSYNEATENTAQLIEAVHGEPVQFDDRQLNRLAGELSAHYEEFGNLDGYSADPSFYQNVSDSFNMNVFKETSVCNDCGALDPLFKQLLEDQSNALAIIGDVQTVDTFWSIVFSRIITLLLTLVMVSFFAMLAIVILDAKTYGYDWKSLRWVGVEPQEKLLRFMSPLYFYVLYPIVRRNQGAFDQALRDLNLYEQYESAISVLKKLKNIKYPPRDISTRAQSLEEVIQEIDTAVAEYRPELESHDTTNRALQQRADSLVEDLTIKIESRRAAQGELERL